MAAIDDAEQALNVLQAFDWNVQVGRNAPFPDVFEPFLHTYMHHGAQAALEQITGPEERPHQRQRYTSPLIDIRHVIWQIVSFFSRLRDHRTRRTACACAALRCVSLPRQRRCRAAWCGAVRRNARRCVCGAVRVAASRGVRCVCRVRARTRACMCACVSDMPVRMPVCPPSSLRLAPWHAHMSAHVPRTSMCVSIHMSLHRTSAPALNSRSEEPVPASYGEAPFDVFAPYSSSRRRRRREGWREAGRQGGREGGRVTARQ